MHKSHLFNLGYIEFMKAHNVEICCFPPHCTHILQPLDYVPFVMFKGKYQCQLLRINRLLCGYKMSRVQFFRVLVPAYTIAMTPEGIRAGFKNTGIYPVNQQAEKLKQLHPSDTYDKCKSILGLYC